MQSSVLRDSFMRDLKKDLDDYCRGLEKSLKLAYTYIPLKTDEEYSKVLRFRHFNEQRHAEMAAFWVRSTPEDDVKKSLSHQSWEEYEHGIWLEALMKKYPIDPWDYVPTPEQTGCHVECYRRTKRDSRENYCDSAIPRGLCAVLPKDYSCI